MSLMHSKYVKKYIITLALVLLGAIIISQALAYLYAVQFKSLLIRHDYELAGRMVKDYPQLASEVPLIFTSEKTAENFEEGRNTLKQTGYVESIDLNLLPQMDEFYKRQMITTLIFSILLSFFIILLAYRFLHTHSSKIDSYTNDVAKITEGEIFIRLNDTEEGNLSKLAASINLLSSSLNSHIEKEKQSRIFLKDVLANISHQLKTPLSALFMYNEIMREENRENAVITDFLNKSENQLGRMQILITNLLKLARLDAGIIQLEKNKYILNEILEQVAGAFTTRLLKEQKTFALTSQHQVAYVCDKEWMYEAFSNLLKNAIEHTSPGNKITIALEETPLLVKIVFMDNGEGIHPEDINHVFKRFYRSRFSQNKQGTGIGLTLARTIIEMHGGYVSVESTLHQGTKFTVNLPTLQNCKV